MSPQPQPEHCSSESIMTMSSKDPLSLLAKASATIEDDVQSSSSSSPLHDYQPKHKSPLHKMTLEQTASHIEQMYTPQHANNNDGRQQLDSRILSRMVTAGGPGGATGMPNFRVASMQEFRRASQNSLHSVPEASGLKMKSPNQMFSNANLSSRPTTSLASNSVRGTLENPLLKLMEQRMAAKQTATAADETSSQAPRATKKTPDVVAMTDEQKSALNASISKWSGIGHVAATSSIGKKCTSTSQLKTVDERSTSQPSPLLAPSSSRNDLLQRMSNADPGTQPRQHLEPSQENLIKELIQTQHASVDKPYTQPTPPSQPQLGSSAQDFVAQVLLQQQQQQQQQQYPDQNQQQHRAFGMYAPVSQRGMARSAYSISEIDRLRKANQSVQLRQQIALQERISQQCFLQRQSSKGDVRLSSNGLPNATAMRKRRSSNTIDDDTVYSSRSPSIASNTSSSKIHRSDSHTCVSGSMENLRLSHSRPSRLNMHNQRFSSSGLNGLSSVSSGLDMQNQRFSTGSALGAGMRRTSSKAAMKRNTSSSSWIQSMISNQDTAGKAAAAAYQNLEQHLLKPVDMNTTSSPVKEEIKNVPVQVAAEEYAAPPIERGTSETVIVSDLPDRIKFKDVQIDKKPIDVVKEALSSRGEDANTKPTVEMPDEFFKESEEMYIQEAVDAVRSNDVDALRQLAAEGKNLQCGNRFGETLIHLACRRSHQDVVAFLIKEAGVSIKVRDDYGRTPMHDACWRCTVDLDLMDLLIESCPELLMLSDKRGHTPLDYARREHWEVLIPYLMAKKDKFRPIN